MVDTLCQAGDEVIVPLPCYFNHQMWLSTRAVSPRYLSFNPETAMPDPEEARGLINRDPRDPAGDAKQSQRRDLQPPRCIAQIFEVAREHGIALILDETYRDFIDIDQCLTGCSRAPTGAIRWCIFTAFPRSSA